LYKFFELSCDNSMVVLMSSKMLMTVLEGIHFEKVVVKWKDVREFVRVCSYLGIQLPKLVGECYL
jgi:hypothetical protein